MLRYGTCCYGAARYQPLFISFTVIKINFFSHSIVVQYLESEELLQHYSSKKTSQYNEFKIKKESNPRPHPIQANLHLRTRISLSRYHCQHVVCSYTPNKAYVCSTAHYSDTRMSATSPIWNHNQLCSHSTAWSCVLTVISALHSL